MSEDRNRIENKSLHKGLTEENILPDSRVKGPTVVPTNEAGAETDDNRDASDQTNRVQYVRSEIDDQGNRREVASKGTSMMVSKPKEYSNVAFVVKDTHSKDNVREKTEIILKDRALRAVMHDVYGKLLDHFQQRDWLDEEQIIAQPIFDEIWYWNELTNAAKSENGAEQARQDLQRLLDHLADMEPKNVKLAASIPSLARIMVKDLWLLFRPGTMVISKPFQDEPQLFKVHDFSYDHSNDQTTFNVHVWAFSWTGNELVQEYYEIQVREYQKDDEEMPITDLNCYPVQYYRNGDGHYGPEIVESLKDGLIKRGKFFRKLCRESKHGRQKKYDGELLCTPYTDSYTYDREELKKQTVSSSPVV